MSNLHYALPGNKIEKVKAKLLYISQATYGSDWHSIKHIHHFTEIFYVIQGRGRFLIDQETHDVFQDDLIIVNPNISHTELPYNNQDFEYIVMGIDGLQFLNEEDDEPYDFSILNHADYKHEILFYLRNMVEEAKHKDNYYEEICQNMLELCIMNILRRTNKKMLVSSTKRIPKECKFIENYINENFKDNITLDLLSELTFMNKYYIVHIFKEYKGMSPIKYLISKRVEVSKELLSTTNFSVARVAELAGFSSQSYFSQVFRKETNLSPNRFRQLSEDKDFDLSTLT